MVSWIVYTHIENRLRTLLAELTGKRSMDFKHLELEQLQLLVCKQLGLPTVRVLRIHPRI